MMIMSGICFKIIQWPGYVRGGGERKIVREGEEKNNRSNLGPGSGY